MEWYYADSGRQVGPVTERDFEKLAKEGKITANTLVWKQGMTDWQQYGKITGRSAGDAPKAGDVTGVAGHLFCSQCGKSFPQDDMIRYGNAWVCAVCKPIFIQMLKEGVSLAGTMEYAGFWIRFGAKIIDWIILSVINAFVSGSLSFMMASSSDRYLSLILVLISNAFLFAFQVAYVTWFLGRFGATPGKMACRLKVVMPDGGRVSYSRALGRYFGEFLSGMTLLIGYFIAAFDDQKRTLHDRICNTRVVRN